MARHSSEFDHSIEKILLERGLPEVAYVTDKDIARKVENNGRKPSYGTLCKARWHMGGAINCGKVTVNAVVPPTVYKVLRVEDGEYYPGKAVCCLKVSINGKEVKDN